MTNNLDILVGIDFGTSNTVITYFKNNKANILMDSIFKTIPSRISKFNDKFYCGNYIPTNSQNIIHSFKTNICNNLYFSFNDNIKYSHNELLLIFFNHLYDIINKNLNLNNQKIKAVITVPSNFNDNQREIIRNTFELVNINVIRIINEPSAAALAYGLNYSSNPEEKILVIDTGGGTMDFTVLEKTDTFFEIIHSEGINDLGGNNFTELIINDISKNFNLDIHDDKKTIWNQAQNIKEKLSYITTFETTLSQRAPLSDETNINNTNYIITRNKFENLAQHLINRIEKILNKLINNYNDINYIILVGGTSRIPILQDTIKNITKKNVWIHPNLESVVSEGACLYGSIIENKYTLNNDVILLDVLPLSLGVELSDGSYSIIIPKNTPLPVKRSQKYTTDTPGDNSIKIKVYQGERKIANKNFLIGEFIFDKVSSGTNPIIEIIFKVDNNSIINIFIIDKKTGIEKNIIIKDIPKITDTEINNIIEQANKLNDIEEYELTKIQNIYLIKSHIENSLINLQINNLINEDYKKELINKFNQIENNIDNMDNIQLIETLKNLQENYSLLNNNNIENNNLENNQFDIMILNDKKKLLKNKIELLLIKNPDWNEYLNPVLEELSFNNISMDYIDDKLNLINELEFDKDYKKEVNNLCLYLKQEIENGNINFEDDNKNELLKNTINDTINLLLLNNENTDWKEELDKLNKKCEEIYLLK